MFNKHFIRHRWGGGGIHVDGLLSEARLFLDHQKLFCEIDFTEMISVNTSNVNMCETDTCVSRRRGG